MQRAQQVAAVVLDLLAIACLIWLLPPVVEQFSELHWVNALIIAAGYLAMCAGLVLARTYTPQAQQAAAVAEDADKPDRSDSGGALGCALATAIPFSIFVTVNWPLTRSGTKRTRSPALTAFSIAGSPARNTMVMPSSISNFLIGPCLMVILPADSSILVTWPLM